MTEPSVTVTIDRSSLSLTDLVFSGTRLGASFGIVRFIPPAMIRRNVYMADAANIHGSEKTASARQQVVLGFDWFPIGAANQAAVQAARLEVEEAVEQFSFTVTTQVGGAPAEVWQADPGQMNLGGSDGLTYVDLKFLQPVYAVSIPVYPIPA